MLLTSTHAARGERAWPVAALTFNAAVWGLSWWPFRQLAGEGLHALWATCFIFTAAALLLGLTQRQAIGEVLRHPSLWLVMVASGTTNAAFNWAMAEGDVVRVVLLFYLMPLWAVLLARIVLKEALTPGSLGQVGLALLGAMIVLWPADAGWSLAALPIPQSLPDWLGVLGGFAFALNNVLIKKVPPVSRNARPLAMFAGGIVVAGVLSWSLSSRGAVPWPPTLAWPWVLGVVALTACFLASNFAFQYGALRMPARITAIVMISEVVFAAVSAIWLGAGTLTPALTLGGALILGAALLATLTHND